MGQLPEKLIEFYDRLESEIVLAAGSARWRSDSLKKVILGPIPNWLEQAAYSGYVALIETRNNLHTLFPDLRTRSITVKEYNITYY